MIISLSNAFDDYEHSIQLGRLLTHSAAMHSTYKLVQFEFSSFHKINIIYIYIIILSFGQTLLLLLLLRYFGPSLSYFGPMSKSENGVSNAYQINYTFIS